MSTSAHTAPRRRFPKITAGDRLRRIRRDMGINQQRFAELLGEHPKTYAAWELDTTKPRDMVALAKRIELLSGVPAAWTLGVETGPEIDPDGRGEVPGTEPETRK